MIIVCKHCKRPFEKPDSFVSGQRKINPNHCRFCSRECVREWRKAKNWETLICEHCGKEFRHEIATKNNRPDRGQYCSKECHYASGHATITCEKCGKEFGILKYYEGKRKYCSTKCAGNRKAKRHEATCKICGKKYFVIKSKLKYTKCCSVECRGIHVGNKLRKHAEKNRRRCSAAKWKKAREKALKRDGYKCTICGTSKILVVHHIVPWRKTQDDRLQNLTTLCRKCHGTIEPPPLRKYLASIYPDTPG